MIVKILAVASLVVPVVSFLTFAVYHAGIWQVIVGLFWFGCFCSMMVSGLFIATAFDKSPKDDAETKKG